MAIAAIHDWLRVRGTYALGLELLRMHGRPSAAELFLLQQGESPFSRQRMERRLRTVNDAAIEAVSQVVTVSASPEVVPPHEEEALRLSLADKPPQDMPEEALPPQLQPLRRDLKQWHQEMLILRGMMMKTPDGQELRGIAEQVVELHERIRNGWRVIEYYRATGQVMGATPERKVDVVDLTRELRALGVWLSQRKTGARKSSPEQIDQRKARKVVVEQLLKDASAHR